MDYFILVSSIILGAITVRGLKLHEPRHIKLFNSFTGAFLLCLTLLHLLPELYDFDHNAAGAEHEAILLGACMLVGFFVQLALDYISMGVEHGHGLDAHSHEEHSHDEHEHDHHSHDHDHVHGHGHDHDHGHAHAPGGHPPYGVVAGLCVHALVEGLGLGNAQTYYDPSSRQLLLWSIVVHNYPVSIALLGMLIAWGLTFNRALAWLGLFAAMGPIGMFLSGHVPILAAHSRELMAIVIGIFMHISTTILFESGETHKIHIPKLIAIIIGCALGILTVMFH
jgi:zinc and cadmium transporter